MKVPREVPLFRLEARYFRLADHFFRLKAPYFRLEVPFSLLNILVHFPLLSPFLLLPVQTHFLDSKPVLLNFWKKSLFLESQVNYKMMKVPREDHFFSFNCSLNSSICLLLSFPAFSFLSFNSRV